MILPIALHIDSQLPESEQTAFRQHLLTYGVVFSEFTTESSSDFRLPESLYLHADQHGLSLAKIGIKGEVRAEFAQGAARHRRLYGGGELLSRAVDSSKNRNVWDTTGGLGRDAFVLAALGLHVQVLERNAVVCALLADGLRRALLYPDTAAIAQRVVLHHKDAVVFMQERWGQGDAPDVVYLDPMYPPRQKSAAVKKEMAYFHELLGESHADDDVQLLNMARRCAKQRVVVKRPSGGVFLANCPPAYQYTGKSTRFDVYSPLPVP